jgi:hypothetical protein
VLCYFTYFQKLTPLLEGVWMSITPTDDALLVALDFEGQ